jgi:adenylosuccinate synthase
MIKYADIVVDLQSGDTGKGKVTHALASSPGEYTHIVRYNGGHNAGHTIFHNGKKIVTHVIPCGIIHGIKSIIGPGCVVNIPLFFEELNELKQAGFDTSLVKIDKRVHAIMELHLLEEQNESKIGTTKKGNGPAYRDKYNRKGVRIQDMLEKYPELGNHIIDIYEEFHGEQECKILFEGAQGFELDIDWGDYPYVTSSHCTAGSACLNGVPPTKIRNIYGIAKVYETYVGSKKFEGDDSIFSTIREAGSEYGATTGRPRQVNWLDLDKLQKAISINGVTHLIFNKLDILEKVDTFKLYKDNNIYSFKYCDEFMDCIYSQVDGKVAWFNVTFSRSPETI